MGETKNKYKHLVGKHERKRPIADVNRDGV
jgi:hypothetical protein